MSGRERVSGHTAWLRNEQRAGVRPVPPSLCCPQVTSLLLVSSCTTAGAPDVWCGLCTGLCGSVEQVRGTLGQHGTCGCGDLTVRA